MYVCMYIYIYIHRALTKTGMRRPVGISGSQLAAFGAVKNTTPLHAMQFTRTCIRVFRRHPYEHACPKLNGTYTTTENYLRLEGNGLSGLASGYTEDPEMLVALGASPCEKLHPKFQILISLNRGLLDRLILEKTFGFGWVRDFMVELRINKPMISEI